MRNSQPSSYRAQVNRSVARDAISIPKGVRDSDGAQVIVSSFNALGDGRYYDPESKTSFVFDPVQQVVSLGGSTRRKLRPI